MKNSPARRAALKFLLRTPSAHQDQLSGGVDLPPRERALYLELIRGVVRLRVTLRAVLAQFCKRSLRHVDSTLLTVLEIGAYQLLVLDRIPEFAAVSSTMDLLSQGHRKQRGFVNGILRSLARSREHISPCPDTPSSRVLHLEAGKGVRFDCDVFPDPADDREGFLSAQHGLSREALQIVTTQLADDEVERFLCSINQRPQFTLRVTGDRAAVMEELGSDVVQRDDGLLLWQGDGSPSSTDPHQAGQVVVQGSFAARVAPLVAPVGGERILDLCGAPGGKALHLAHICREASIVVGVIDERGASRTKENIARLGLTNCSVQDVSDLESVLSAEPFDAILLDVPCSNSGVLNRRPFARHRLSPSTQQDLIKAQSKLLLRALRYASQLESHPRVVYSTCSVLSDENEHLVRRCLERSSSYRVAQEIRAIAASAADDGGYAALLQFD